MRYRFIVGIDPSGNFNEGKGTTGCCILDAETKTIIETNSISATDYLTQFDYWKAVLTYIIRATLKYKNVGVVVEDFLLYKTKAENQINSKMETPKLIGVLEYFCTEREIPIILQPAHAVKNRWNNEILIHKGFMSPYKGRLKTHSGKLVDRHAIDAIRHAVHYATFKNK